MAAIDEARVCAAFAPKTGRAKFLDAVHIPTVHGVVSVSQPVAQFPDKNDRGWRLGCLSPHNGRGRLWQFRPFVVHGRRQQTFSSRFFTWRGDVLMWSTIVDAVKRNLLLFTEVKQYALVTACRLAAIGLLILLVKLAVSGMEVSRGWTCYTSQVSC